MGSRRVGGFAHGRKGALDHPLGVAGVVEEWLPCVLVGPEFEVLATCTGFDELPDHVGNLGIGER